MSRSKEETALLEAYDACGLEVPAGVSFDVLRRMIHEAVTPTEVPAVNDVCVNWKSVDFMRAETVPAIAKMFESPDHTERERAQHLAFALGRLNGKYFGEALENHCYRPLVIITPLGVEMPNGYRIQGNLQGAQVVEFGMGMNGTMNHILNLHKDVYLLSAMSKNSAEIAAVNGVLDYFRLCPEQVRQYAGIAEGAEAMIEEGYAGQVDLILALRASMAGEALRQGIKDAHRLLRVSGVLIAMGAREEPEGIDYDQIAGLVALQEASGTMRIVGDKLLEYSGDDRVFGGPTRLTVAQRTAA